MNALRSVLPLLVSTAIGCGGSSSPATSPPAGTSAPSASADAAAPSVRATFDGKPLGLVRFDAYSLSADEMDLHLSTHAECGREISLKCPAGESEVSLRVANTIAPDGSRSWRIVSAGVNSSTDGANAAVKFDGDPKSKVTLTIPKLVIHEKELVIEGQVVAAGHTVEAPAGTPQPQGKLSIGGVEIPIQSAYLERGTSGDTLSLYGGVMASCHSGDGALAQPAGVFVMVDKSGAPDVRVDGDLIQRTTGVFESKSTITKLTVGAEKDGKFPVSVEVDYTWAGYAIKATGTFVAARCE